MFEKLKTKIRGTIDIDRLKSDGCVIGKNFHAQQGTIIDPGHCWLIEIGDNVTLAPYVHILAHDASTKIATGYTKIGRVRIGNNVFIGAGTIVLPNVTIGDNVVVGSGSLVVKSLPGGGVYAGNPCMKIADYDEWVKNHERKIAASPKFDESYIIGNATAEKKKEMKERLKDGIGYIV